VTCRILMGLKTLWRFFPCRKSVSNIGYFFISLILGFPFFLERHKVAEDGIGSKKTNKQH